LKPALRRGKLRLHILQQMNGPAIFSNSENLY
jgi:hypothetical protein